MSGRISAQRSSSIALRGASEILTESATETLARGPSSTGRVPIGTAALAGKGPARARLRTGDREKRKTGTVRDGDGGALGGLGAVRWEND